MEIEKRLYSNIEVGQIIKNAVADIVERMKGFASASGVEQSVIMREWADELLPMVNAVLAEQIVKRHVVGVTFSVWAGPPGSGKGTNIDTVNMLGKVYAEVVSQGWARQLPDPFHSKLLAFSVAQSDISTGNKGMFVKPEGEYLEFFGPLVPLIGQMVADGFFVPDDMVSVLVELMILLRLTQNSHKVQVDLWPRTGPQFDVFQKMVNEIRAAGGKVFLEIVTIKVLKPDSLNLVKNDLSASAEISRQVAKRLKEIPGMDWYMQIREESSVISNPKEKFGIEKKALDKTFEILGKEFDSPLGKVIIEELQTVCDRMEFRFTIVLEKGGIPRPDEYPLSTIRRLAVYAGDISPVFLDVSAKNEASEGYFVVSSAGTPEEVIAEILDALVQAKTDDVRWQKVKTLAGEIANAIVFKKELIVDELIERVGGIVNS